MKILIGKIVKPQGVNGELKVYPNDTNLEQYKNITKIYLDNQEIIVKKWAVRSGFFYLTIPNCKDRNQAELYRGKDVYVDDEQINLNPNTYFTEDIIGCEIYDESDNYISTVLDIENYGATDIFVVQEDGRQYMVPFVTKIFCNVDTKSKKITAKKDLYDEAKVWKLIF